MHRNPVRPPRRLAIEVLESRALLSANGFPGSSAFEAGGFSGTLVANAVTSGVAVGSVTAVPYNGQVGFVAANTVTVPAANAAGPDATTGVGQMTITNGINTPGISSFATPTCGTGSIGGGGMVLRTDSSVTQ